MLFSFLRVPGTIFLRCIYVASSFVQTNHKNSVKRWRIYVKHVLGSNSIIIYGVCKFGGDIFKKNWVGESENGKGSPSLNYFTYNSNFLTKSGRHLKNLPTSEEFLTLKWIFPLNSRNKSIWIKYRLDRYWKFKKWAIRRKTCDAATVLSPVYI